MGSDSDTGRLAGTSAAAEPAREQLKAENISVQFGGLHALAAVDLTVDRREIVGLIGPNGAGKSTLVNVLTGFQAPSEGQVSLDGVDITSAVPQRRARAGLARTFQGARLFGDMTVSENVEVSGVAQGLSRRQARARAVTALETLGLAALANRSANDLTTGQERKLQMARTIAMRPRFVCLDEPAAGLNEAESEIILDVISSLPEQVGCGVLLIEHDMRVVMEACSRIAVLNSGRLIAVGSPREIRSNQAVIDAYLGA